MPIDETRPKCLNCKFWQQLEYGSGLCRKHAPQPASVPIVIAEVGVQRESRWPITFAIDYCSEHPDFDAWAAKVAAAKGS